MYIEGEGVTLIIQIHFLCYYKLLVDCMVHAFPDCCVQIEIITYMIFSLKLDYDLDQHPVMLKLSLLDTVAHKSILELCFGALNVPKLTSRKKKVNLLNILLKNKLLLFPICVVCLNFIFATIYIFHSSILMPNVIHLDFHITKFCLANYSF